VRALLTILRGQERAADKLLDVCEEKDLLMMRERRRVWRGIIRGIEYGPPRPQQNPGTRRAVAESGYDNE